MSLVFFDSNVCIGKRGRKHRLEIWESSDVIAAMDKAGISGALVYAGLSREYSPVYGNEWLAGELEKYKRFYGCYTIAPGYTGSFLKPNEFVSDMRAKNMVAAKMFPAIHDFSVSEDVMGEYYNELEKNNIPLLLDSNQIKITELGEILRLHPDMKLLFQGATWSDFHNLAAYMHKYDNLYIDLSRMQANFAVEIIAREFGAHRICVGSGLPFMCAGAARSFIDYADISEDEKAIMAGKNLAYICGVELPETVEVKNDSIAQNATEGKPMDVFVFDSHTHFLEGNGNCGGGIAMVDGDLLHMRDLCDRMGVDEYCVAPWLGIWVDSEEGNRQVLTMAEKDKRVYPYVLINPAYGTDVEKEATYYHIEKKMPGMKMFYARSGIRYTDPVFDPCL